MMLLSQNLSTRSTVTKVGKANSALINISSTEDQLMSNVSKIKCLVMCTLFFYKVPMTVKYLGLPVVDIRFIGT